MNHCSVEKKEVFLNGLCVRVRACVHVGTQARVPACVHVVLLIHHATCMRHIMTVICGPSVSTIFFDIIS